jgi:hypothetical protein
VWRALGGHTVAPVRLPLSADSEHCWSYAGKRNAVGGWLGGVMAAEVVDEAATAELCRKACDGKRVKIPRLGGWSFVGWKNHTCVVKSQPRSCFWRKAEACDFGMWKNFNRNPLKKALWTHQMLLRCFMLLYLGGAPLNPQCKRLWVYVQKGIFYSTPAWNGIYQKPTPKPKASCQLFNLIIDPFPTLSPKVLPLNRHY